MFLADVKTSPFLGYLMGSDIFNSTSYAIEYWDINLSKLLPPDFFSLSFHFLMETLVNFTSCYMFPSSI